MLLLLLLLLLLSKWTGGNSYISLITGGCSILGTLYSKRQAVSVQNGNFKQQNIDFLLFAGGLLITGGG